jgi:hypothetical protein
MDDFSVSPGNYLKSVTGGHFRDVYRHAQHLVGALHSHAGLQSGADRNLNGNRAPPTRFHSQGVRASDAPHENALDGFRYSAVALHPDAHFARAHASTLRSPSATVNSAFRAKPDIFQPASSSTSLRKDSMIRILAQAAANSNPLPDIPQVSAPAALRPPEVAHEAAPYEGPRPVEGSFGPEHLAAVGLLALAVV